MEPHFGDPASPDLTLLCKGGEAVQVHGFLVALASSPLRPAVALATKERAGEAPAVLKMEEDDASAWKLALPWLDPNLPTPPVCWVRDGDASRAGRQTAPAQRS